jgi:RNA polymerase sigma factor for flagellar operon FliA
MSSTTFELKTPPADEQLAAKQQDLWLRYAKSGAGSPTENTLIEQYLPLVKTVVGRLAMTLPSHVNSDDLYSAGMVGLLNAVRRFDRKCGASFAHYARMRIRGAILDELRRLDWVPRSVHDKAKKVSRVMQELAQRHGGIPTDAQMAAALHLTLDDYEELVEEIRPASYVCLDSMQDDGVETAGPGHDVVADEAQADPGAQTATREMARLVEERLQQLPEMQRQVLALYYLEDLRLREIAEVFGVTESRICQIHAKAILALKALVREQEPEAFEDR